MSRSDIFLARHNAIPAVAEANEERAVINLLGFQVVTDFFTQLVLSGYAYHIQIGTEDAGCCSTTSIDDILVWMVADNVAGCAMIPLLYEVNPGVVAGATLAMAMLEVDKDKARYSSSGTAYVPSNLRTDDPNSASGSFYFTTAAGTGVVTSAKSAVPNSVELARKDFLEDTLADTLGYPGTWDPCIYSVMSRPPCVLVDASSIVCHNGAASADTTGYGCLQFAQFDKDLVV